MRYFHVWLDKNVVGSEPDDELVEMPDNATQKEIDEECGDVLQTMISNALDTGWDEIDEGEAEKLRKRLGRSIGSMKDDDKG